MDFQARQRHNSWTSTRKSSRRAPACNSRSAKFDRRWWPRASSRIHFRPAQLPLRRHTSNLQQTLAQARPFRLHFRCRLLWCQCTTRNSSPVFSRWWRHARLRSKSQRRHLRRIVVLRRHRRIAWRGARTRRGRWRMLGTTQLNSFSEVKICNQSLTINKLLSWRHDWHVLSSITSQIILEHMNFLTADCVGHASMRHETVLLPGCTVKAAVWITPVYSFTTTLQFFTHSPHRWLGIDTTHLSSFLSKLYRRTPVLALVECFLHLISFCIEPWLAAVLDSTVFYSHQL